MQGVLEVRKREPVVPPLASDSCPSGLLHSAFECAGSSNPLGRSVFGLLRYTGGVTLLASGHVQGAVRRAVALGVDLAAGARTRRAFAVGRDRHGSVHGGGVRGADVFSNSALLVHGVGGGGGGQRVDVPGTGSRAHRPDARRPGGRGDVGGDRHDEGHRANRRPACAGGLPGGLPRGAARPGDVASPCRCLRGNAFSCGIATGYFVGCHVLDIQGPYYIDNTIKFMRVSVTWAWGCSRGSVFGLLIVFVSCYEGLQARRTVRWAWAGRRRTRWWPVRWRSWCRTSS